MDKQFSEAFLERTVQFWQLHYKEKLTLEDAREISESGCGLIRLLDQLERKYPGP